MQTEHVRTLERVSRNLTLDQVAIDPIPEPQRLFRTRRIEANELENTRTLVGFEFSLPGTVTGEHQPERRPDPEVLLRLRHLFLDREMHPHGSAQVSALRCIRRRLGRGYDHGNLPCLLFGTSLPSVARNFSRFNQREHETSERAGAQHEPSTARRNERRYTHVSKCTRGVLWLARLTAEEEPSRDARRCHRDAQRNVGDQVIALHSVVVGVITRRTVRSTIVERR